MKNRVGEKLKKILITGALGFIGMSLSKYHSQKGYKVYGIGHGKLNDENEINIFVKWVEGDITLENILRFNEKFDIIVHCGGSGSVGASIEKPYQDFKKTVEGTAEVLEYIRKYNSNAHLIYPSSPAVQGECQDTPIKESYVGKPCSPYGYHKRMAEDLCRSYYERYNIKISIIRLFSVYGEGLKKQLLWDACQKMITDKDEVLFFGTGEETRDFIHVDDVIQIIERVIKKSPQFEVYNGGTGNRTSIEELVMLIKKELRVEVDINFNNEVNVGNPIYYLADVTKLNELQVSPKIELEEGIRRYCEWIKSM